MIIGSLMSSSFLGAENLSNVFTRESAIIEIIAIGATFVITASGLDPIGQLAEAMLVAGVAIMVMNQATGSFGTGWLLVAAGIVFSLLLGALLQVSSTAR